MERNNGFGFIWFLIFALYAGALALCALDFTSAALLPVLFAMSVACSSKKPLLSGAMLLVTGAVCLFTAGEGDFLFCAMLLALSLVCLLAFRRGFAFGRTACIMTAVVFLFATGLLLRQVYLENGAFGTEQVTAYVTARLSSFTQVFSQTAAEMYGDMIPLSAQQLSDGLVSVLVGSMGGILIMLSSIMGIFGAAVAHKVRYPRAGLLDSYDMSPVGAVVVTVSFIVFLFGSGRASLIGENLFFALMPAFAVQGVKGIINIFRSRRIPLFGLLLVIVVVFNAGVLPALVLIGVADVIGRMFVHERQK